MRLFLSRYSFPRMLAFGICLLVGENLAAIGARMLFKYYYDHTTNPLFDIREVFGYALLSTFVCSLYACSVFLKRIFMLITQNHNMKLELADKQNQVLKLKYRSLKQQLNPHFLFNSLNTLCEIVQSSPDLAESFTESLAYLYRYTLHNSDKDLVPLAEEIKYAETYFFLMKIRRGEHITLDISGNYQQNAQLIPPTSIQLLIENAIKHNRSTEKEPLHILINIGNDRLTVINNKQPIHHSPNTSGKGLQNINERFLLLGNRQIDVDNSEKLFTVSLPLFNNAS